MRWRSGLIGTAAVAALFLGGNVFADPAAGGTYLLRSRGTGWFSKTYEVKLWIEKQPDGSLKVARQELWKSTGQPGPTLFGTATQDGSGVISMSFTSTGGISGVLNPSEAISGSGRYTLSGSTLSGSYEGPDINLTRVVKRRELGTRVTDEPMPGSGDNGGNGGGNNGGGEPAGDLAGLGAQVVKIEAVGTIAIKDVPGAIFERALEAQAPSVQEPCALLKNEKLKLRVSLAARSPAAAPIAARLTGSANGAELFAADVNVTGQAQSIEVESKAPISAKVAINALQVSWKLNEVAVGESALRVYTLHGAPIHNIAWDSTETATKRHFENACRWANGASQNIGQGPDSIPHQIDNQMKHLVHWDSLGSFVPVVPDYAKGAAAPKNYKDLGGSVSTSTGLRSNSSLYYPPLEPDEDYEQYTNYRNNFGWFLLDNPTHVGGRCNQQASLVCAINGTVGIKGQVHYLERTGRGKTSGRPVRQYFFAQGGGGPWNFHGVALIDLDDGSQWIYDGSFSFPPNRKNGTREWAENAGGPFVGSWADWYYEDFGGKVPATDIPDSWSGVQ